MANSEKPGSASIDPNSASPWIFVRAQMHDHAMTLAGIPARKFYWDAQTFVDTWREVANYYAMDVVNNALADGYNFEIEAMGAKMVYSDNAMPTVDFREPLIKQPADLYKLKTPDFYHDGRLPYALEYMKLCESKYGLFCGIFSMAVGMRSYTALIKDMRKRPEFAHEIFTFITDEVLAPYLRVQKEYCGIEIAEGADAWATVPNLSVQELNEWVVPYNQRLIKMAREFGVKAILASGDYCEEELLKFDAEVVKGSFDIQISSRIGGIAVSDLREPGEDTLARIKEHAAIAELIALAMGRWHEYPLEPVREYSAKYRERGINFSIRAGINAQLLRNGPVDKIVNSVKRYIEAFAKDHRLIISLANIPADAPCEHIHAVVAAVHTYGRLPIADDLDKIEFRPPKRETFQEWREKQS
jgi:uroporphyrinogen-III decarboxylase